MTYVVTQPCCNDASCVAVCPVNCIHPTPDESDYARTEMLYIDPNTCIDCGACADACPIDAIVPDSDLDEGDMPYLEINADYFEDPKNRNYPGVAAVQRHPVVGVTGATPLRVAIVGTGPAACYAGEELLASGATGVEVHFFERLPTPWGLVRFGVAPDHQQTKSVSEAFSRIGSRRGAYFHLNVEIGKHLTHEELLTHFHAVIYAVGAHDDRRLGIAGEDLPGSYSASDFVSWYNGHPDGAQRSFDLSGTRAVVVGNGNVALDVARMLSTDVKSLARTDIADHALTALAGSAISEVVVLGRRGPAQAAYTTPELLGLAAAEGIDLVVDSVGAESIGVATTTAEPSGMSAAVDFKSRLFDEIAAAPTTGAPKRIVLRFLSSPIEILGDDRVRGLRVQRNELVETTEGEFVVRPTDQFDDIECGLVIRSIGYRGTPLAGLPFDDKTGTVPNEKGRVFDPITGEAVAGVYVAGWIKRGPSGSIGNNSRCARDTVRALVEDYSEGRLTAPALDNDALTQLVSQRQSNALTYTDWKTIDQFERSAARKHNRPRIKLVDIDSMLGVARP
ncbi:4Fe-4S binding protein [Rhodococcus erythropolis]|uniref:Putative ferredoxin--NADP(+) reductase n=1 Tax=Rhodococcus erythropolis (strain PR4 / NBRC 100887) TaxID=234621 RepID=C0ZQ37_RHOE4|nr:4Fe-4S binding protein [Rhodococcus erythropolis]BAH31515.1 putative ferredoxin--NADP(+) reductase [Rhodococcus erythropolis PR4]